MGKYAVAVGIKKPAVPGMEKAAKGSMEVVEKGKTGKDFCYVEL